MLQGHQWNTDKKINYTVHCESETSLVTFQMDRFGRVVRSVVNKLTFTPARSEGYKADNHNFALDTIFPLLNAAAFI